MLGPAIGELDREESTVSNEDLAMQVHGDTSTVFGGESELDVAGNGVVELITGAARNKELGYALHQEGMRIKNKGLVGVGVGGWRDERGGPVGDVGLAGHDFEEGRAGSGLVGRGGQWV